MAHKIKNRERKTKIGDKNRLVHAPVALKNIFTNLLRDRQFSEWRRSTINRSIHSAATRRRREGDERKDYKKKT